MRARGHGERAHDPVRLTLESVPPRGDHGSVAFVFAYQFRLANLTTLAYVQVAGKLEVRLHTGATVYLTPTNSNVVLSSLIA